MLAYWYFYHYPRICSETASGVAIPAASFVIIRILSLIIFYWSDDRNIRRLITKQCPEARTALRPLPVIRMVLCELIRID